MAKYVYFVSYAYRDGITRGFGNAEIGSKDRVTSMAEISALADALRIRYKLDLAPVVLYFQLLREEKDQE